MGGMNYDDPEYLILQSIQTARTRQTSERLNSREGQEPTHTKGTKYDTLHPRVLLEETFWILVKGKGV